MLRCCSRPVPSGGRLHTRAHADPSITVTLLLDAPGSPVYGQPYGEIAGRPGRAEPSNGSEDGTVSKRLWRGVSVAGGVSDSGMLC
jgi:hypothetical protein